MRRGLLLALPALLLACGDPVLGGADGDIRLNPSTLTFEAYAHYGQIRQVEIINSGRSARLVSLDITAPFRLHTGSVTARSGSTPVDIQFYPGRADDFAGDVTLTVPGTTITSTTTLLGHAEDAPPCNAPTACDFAERDPDTGVCRTGALLEGAECVSGNECQVQERCVAHQCVGVPRDCDDGDLCTDDSCNPLLGKCVHLDVTCPDPDPGEACKVPRCSPTRGCYIANAPVRTQCGEFSCELAQWCNEDGVCESAVPPEEYPCDRECGAGVCESGKCVRKDGPKELMDGKIAFETTSPVFFTGITDDDGASYLFTRVEDNYALISVNADGFQRYVSPRSLPYGDRFPRMLRWDDRLFVSVGSAVDLRSTDDGESVWSGGRFIITHDGPPLQSVDVAVAARTGDRLITAAHEVPTPEITCAGGDPDRVVHIYGLDPLMEIAWERTFPGRLLQRDAGRSDLAEQGLVVDETGTIWFTIGRCTFDDELIGLDVDGKDVQRVRLQGCQGCETLAASGGVVALAGGLLVRPADKDPLHPLDLPGSFAPRLGSRTGYMLGESAVYGIDLEGAAVSWTHEMPLGTSLHDAVLIVSSEKTRPGTSLLAFDVRQAVEGDTWLTELLTDGTAKRACTLGKDFVMEGPPAIETDALLVFGRDPKLQRTQLRRYVLPRLRLAGSGWVSHGGNATRDWAAR